MFVGVDFHISIAFINMLVNPIVRVFEYHDNLLVFKRDATKPKFSQPLLLGEVIVLTAFVVNDSCKFQIIGLIS